MIKDDAGYKISRDGGVAKEVDEVKNHPCVCLVTIYCLYLSAVQQQKLEERGRVGGRGGVGELDCMLSSSAQPLCLQVAERGRGGGRQGRPRRALEM